MWVGPPPDKEIAGGGGGTCSQNVVWTLSAVNIRVLTNSFSFFIFTNCVIALTYISQN